LGITAATAARLACDARIVGVIRGLDGQVLHHGHSRRTVSTAQRRALLIRDSGCGYPACQRTQGLDAHHIIPWAAGGPTDLDNLILLCRFHHLAVHEGIAYLEALPVERNGCPRFVFRLPDGTEMTPAMFRGDRRDEGETDWLDLQRTTWSSPEARAIRPLWTGERFDMAAIVGSLFNNLTPSSEDAENVGEAA
jgi:hypothetical protein